MISWLVGAVPGLVATFAFVLFLRGYRMLRTDPELNLDENEALLLHGAGEDEGSKSALQTLAERIAPSLRAMLPHSAIRAIQRQVDMAGRPSGLDVDAVLSQVGRWLLLLAPVMVVAVFTGNILYLPLSIAVAFLLPLAQLSGRARVRAEQVARDLPDFLDVLAVTVSAGLGFRSALGVVADRFGGPLGEEIRTTLNQMSNGASLRSAFTSLRARTHSEPVDEFVTAYLQSEELGAPLVETLNQIAADMRRANAQRMRQQAAKIEPRISLIMTMVLIPGALIILVAGMFLALGADRIGGLFGG